MQTNCGFDVLCILSYTYLQISMTLSANSENLAFRSLICSTWFGAQALQRSQTRPLHGIVWDLFIYHGALTS